MELGFEVQITARSMDNLMELDYSKAEGIFKSLIKPPYTSVLGWTRHPDRVKKNNNCSNAAMKLVRVVGLSNGDEVCDRNQGAETWRWER